MPVTNPFGDTIAKDSLRRRDLRRLQEFASRNAKTRGLSYCGLTSVEFRDVQVWSPVLGRVYAVERNKSLLDDMQINWNELHFSMPLQIINADILADLQRSDAECFDVYNLDFYGGFTHPKKNGNSACRDAIRAIVGRHQAEHSSFVLIATFNFRDRGLELYDALIGEIQKILSGHEGVAENLTGHKKNIATRIKLSFIYTSWELGALNDFIVDFADPVWYRGDNASLIHFYCEFRYRARSIPSPVADRDHLIEGLNRPLFKQTGRVREIEMLPARIKPILV